MISSIRYLRLEGLGRTSRRSPRAVGPRIWSRGSSNVGASGQGRVHARAERREGAESLAGHRAGDGTRVAAAQAHGLARRRVHRARARGARGSEPVVSGREGAALLERRLASLRLRTVRMGDDGNCQFRALAHGLFGDQDAHQRVRDVRGAHASASRRVRGILRRRV